MRHSAPRDITKLMIGEVYLADHRRPVDVNKVRELARSIDEIGLQNPIIVRTVPYWNDPVDGELDGAYVLVSGRHRLEAQKLRGETHIEAYIADLDDLHAELAEIDENLIRCNLSPAQEASAIGRRKTIYEELHRETKHGANKTGPSAQFAHTDKPSFTDNTVAATGKHRSTIDRAAARAVALGDDLAAVEGTSLDKGVELDALAKMPASERRTIIGRAQSGEQITARTSNIDGDVKERAANEVAQLLAEYIPASAWDGLKANLYASGARSVANAFTNVTGQSIMDGRYGSAA